MTTTTHTLPATTHIGSVHLIVANLERGLDFYGRQMGFRELRRDGATVTLSADGATPHILLTEQSGAAPKPARSTGLYHVAIRYPDRPSLARAFRRLVTLRYPFGGFSDHAVSEALYLSDPDGNGLEMYVDRPRDQWPRLGDDIQMTTQPLDVDDLLAQADADSSPWDGISTATDIGHVHLHVSDLGQAKAFWVDLIGLDIAADWSGHGALFVAAGGYHHHLGLNIWAGKTAPPPNTVGLRAFQLVIPDRAGWDGAVARLERAGIVLERLPSGGVRVRDNDQNAVDLVSAQA